MISDRGPRGEQTRPAGRPSSVRLVRACLALSFLPALTLGCPKKSGTEGTPAPVASSVVGGPAEEGGAPIASEFDASTPAKPEVSLKTDWVNRSGDAPDIKYETAGLPALSADGQLVVVPHHEENAAYPNLQLVTMRAFDEQRVGTTVIQTVQEYYEALYPPYVDWPTPSITDPKFRDLFKVVERRIASTNAQLAAWKPLPKCRIEEPENDEDPDGGDAGAADAGSARKREVIHCPGLEIIHDKHRLRVVGRGGHVRFERKTTWRRPGWVYPGSAPTSINVVDKLDAIHGDAAHGVLVVHVTYEVTPRYYGRGMQPEWHVIKLN